MMDKLNHRTLTGIEYLKTMIKSGASISTETKSVTPATDSAAAVIEGLVDKLDKLSNLYFVDKNYRKAAEVFGEVIKSAEHLRGLTADDITKRMADDIINGADIIRNIHDAAGIGGLDHIRDRIRKMEFMS